MLLALGTSGGLATAAGTLPADDTAAVTSNNLATGDATTDTAPGTLAADQAVPESADSLSCWDFYLNGSTFAVTCSGNYFWVYVDCANGYRYTYGPLAGTYRVALTCPNGYRALRGGAYGS
ncbi:hypothetical protein [Kitasatospora sp. LaBMicrA B282]|uniref:hypothetical protein n=1 Tax=Kitasatospora sp. LaBMicrA B282 TaxID=3420949 RepID=UPI003D119F6B